MMAISLWQPWAWLVACGAKSCETRSWPTKYRGPIAIHAAKRFIGLEMLKILQSPDWVHWLRVAREHGVPVDESRRLLGFGGLARGKIVAVAHLDDVVQINPLTKPLSYQEVAFGDYTTGRFRWDLRDVHALKEPIPCRGRQGLWRLDSAETAACYVAAGITKVGA